MGEELDHFLEEQRAKLAQDQAELEKDPPYMEIRSKKFENTHVADQPRIYAKENIPPNRLYQKEASQKQIPDTGYGLSLPLGEDYERKKHKLKEELRQDYRRYLNQKHLRTTGEVDPVTHGMSLPIGERLSAKERLRLERNREYNQFLRMKDEEQERIHNAALEEERNVLNYKTQKRVESEQYQSVPISNRDQALPKKDAYTSMEVYEQLLNKRRSEAERTGRRDNETETENPFIRRPDVNKDMMDHPQYSSRDWEAERRPLRLNLSNEVDDNNTSRLKYGREVEDRRSMRYNPHPERIVHQHGDRENREYRPDRASYFQMERSDLRPHKDRKDREYPVDYEDNFREQSNRRPATSLMKNRAKIEHPVQQIERSKSANIKDENFSTGLMLGGADKEEAQKRRKERYREELMQQMAEQQRNKKREKELELKVAASGAVDPEKQPDRLRQFGAINRHQEISDRNVPYRPGILIDPQKTSRTDLENRPLIEEKSPPERPRVAFQTPLPEPAVTGNAFPSAFNPANEEYHRGIANTLGEIVAPRIAVVPPPQPPVLVDNYRTPYDDAYYYYGARNLLDPNLAYYAPGMTATQTPAGINMPVPQMYPGDHLMDNKQRPGAGRGASLGAFPEERPRQTREAVISYQEELERQIRERNDRRRKEKEEREHYDAKLEADMKSYNPWGKGGGGAPLKDQKGNLITDLKQMHKQNEDAYQNPDVRAFEDRRAVVAVDTSLADHSMSTGKIPGFSFANNSQFARGNVFSEPVTEQQVQQQESYKNFLRQQIDEKRRKEEEERERIRLEEEREEKRLAEQRAKIQREFEEEQNRKKMKEEEQRQKNDELVRLADERRKETERKRKEEEAKHEEEMKRLYEQERAANVNEDQDGPLRQPSPVIPTLQHKLTSRTQRPPTAESVASVQSHGEPHSRTGSPPVPARRNQLRAYDEKKSVISELTELRKQLRSEQRRLEGRLQDTERDNDSLPSMSGRRREKTSADIFDLARQRLQATVRRPSLKGPDNVNMQNIRDFNDLKYRDTDTREGVRIMFPDPPQDDQTLEIQQQALLREQQKNLYKIKGRAAIPDDFGLVHAYSLHRPGMLSDPSKDLLKTSLLESESAFIGENGEPYPAFFDALPSARERRRHKNKGLDYDNDFPPVPPIPLHQPDRYSLNSAASLNVDELRTRNDERLRRLSNLQKSTVSIDEDPDGFENAEDFMKPFPTKPNERPQSVDTVATDPWMRPGTSETLKKFMAGQMNNDKSTSENALTFNWQGLSTAHG